MAVDYVSVLMAAGAAGVALCFTLVMSWLRERASVFLLIWAVGIGMIVAAIVCFWGFQSTGEGPYATVAGVLLTSAFALSYGGMTQFRDGRFDALPVVALAIMSGFPIVLTALLGFDALSFIAINFMSAVLLSINGYHYWRMRAESPVPIAAIALLHFMLVISYVLCVVVMALETPLHLDGQMPDNWAEGLNLVASVIAITGIGGLFVTVHQERISKRHYRAALTDPLTGLHNRRALYERYPNGMIGHGAALVVFDLDEFKGHNDRHGHAFGDMVLRDFSVTLQEHSRSDDMAVRLGGEEFALLLSTSSTTHAMAVAERIRTAMSRRVYGVSGGLATCTVSAGVAVAGRGEAVLDALIRKADNALYTSKREGRNRVSRTSSAA